jgi:hypothetical protein
MQNEKIRTSDYRLEAGELKFFKVVAFCDYLRFFISVELEQEIFWKTVLISFDLFIQSFGRYT